MSKEILISDIIRKKTKHKCEFLELEYDEQKEVLDYILTNNINIRVFGQKWYDILSNKFIAIEYTLSNSMFTYIDKKEVEFDTFDDFINCIKKDIYKNSCFYGYTFSKDTINSYSIDIKNINFDSFINENIDSYSFYNIKKNEDISKMINANRAYEMHSMIYENKPITTLEELEKQLDIFCERFNIWEAKRIFFSMIIRNDSNSIKKILIDFICKNDISQGISFENILITYGVEAALSIIDNFDGGCSYRTKKERIKCFKDMLVGYTGNLFDINKQVGFDSSLQLYYVREIYQNGINYSMNIINYFFSFDEFCSYLKGDLRGAFLRDAPIDKYDISKYTVDSSTKLPFLDQYKSYKIIKEYVNNQFIVEQKWYNDSDILVLHKVHEFKHFFDFVHFLKGDLSEADLILCDGIENIKNIKGLNLKNIKVRSDVANILGLPIKLLSNKKLLPKSFEKTNLNEITKIEDILDKHPLDDDYSDKVSYITDLHLLHRFDIYKCSTPDDIKYITRTIANTISEQATSVNLIGGDTSSNFDIFKIFLKDLSSSRTRGHFFFTIGNHELWAFDNENLDTIIEKYKNVIDKIGQHKMHLIQNNLFFFDNEWEEITENELSNISVEELKKNTSSAKILIFGGIGFAGKNEEFNANDGIYMGILDRENEINETNKFVKLYEKVTEALKDRNLIVFTHMPMKDWGGPNIHAKDKIVYINGHSHRNFYYDDGIKRIYADNQVGYKGKNISLKQVGIDFSYDWFADYKDGIYEITKKDYVMFYRGINENLTFNRQYSKIYLLKREKTYMFLMETEKGNRLILNGGAIRTVGKHSLEYFYENMVNYSKSVSMYLSNYDKYQKQLSEEIKKIGGDGRIHGSIIDIDFYNHIYLNPLDGSITPYFAYSMINKYVYENLPSLLKYHCPQIYINYEMMIKNSTESNQLMQFNKKYQISNNNYYVDSTEMYKVSRILKGLQFTTKYNIIRLWNDNIIADPSEENGRLIVTSIINPDKE